ncbi:hypothetical protein ACFE04_011535 [Oxalis oulophora]
MESPREHIDRIRRSKFSIGGEENPLSEDLHEAVKHLSAELYAKDVHFLMELIQNAEDNEYGDEIDPSLQFVITSTDITCTGAPATLILFNNENGFSPKNIDSICSVGRSTKKGNRKRGYIGEKGIGFKSVFLITSQPYIFSNGYQIRFNEGPCPLSNLGYIVPEWVEDNPSLADLHELYGSGSNLPTTTLILPLKPDKVDPVKKQLSSIQPEVLLFLSKIKHFSVRESNKDPSQSMVSDIAITSETNLVTRKNIDAESFTLFLSANEAECLTEKQCSYYMWRQKFPVRRENIVDRRMEVDELVITLAFPNQERLDRGSVSHGVYAFLPTEMVTNFPFIIQADFLLASSRESVLLDNKWNKGILDLVPTAFVNAFTSLVKLTDAPVSNLPRMFEFLPVEKSPYDELNVVRESIKSKLLASDIIPSDSQNGQKFLHKPHEVKRISPAFRDILQKAKAQGLSLHNLSSSGFYVLNSSFDRQSYGHILDFLEVKSVDNEWYANCIRNSNLVLGLSEEDYLELLFFIADHWSSFRSTNMKDLPLLKYEDVDGSVSLFSVNSCAQQNGGKVLCQSYEYSWLSDCNKELKCVAQYLFFPKSTEKAMSSRSKKETITNWLYQQVQIGYLTVHEYAEATCDCLINDRKLIINFVRFLYQSYRKKYLSDSVVKGLCKRMPILDNAGYFVRKKTGVLVPGKESNWVKLMSSNLWSREEYIELSEDYLNSGNFVGVNIDGKELVEFLESFLGVSDIPNVNPPNAVIPAVSAPLTKQNAFLLLDWIRVLKYRKAGFPVKFLSCIQNNSWLAITINGHSGFRPPSQSFKLSSTSLEEILENGSVLVDIPLLDLNFYGEKILEYKEELKTIGVMFEFGQACEFIGKRLMSMASSTALKKGDVLSILYFIRFIRSNGLSPNELIKSINDVEWLRTSRGFKSPKDSVLFNNNWKAAAQICSIPFIDEEFYGEEIRDFEIELSFLGVVIILKEQIVVDCLKPSLYLANLSCEAVFVILSCMKQLPGSSNKIKTSLKNTKCLMTDNGYKSPGECFWLNPDWNLLLQVFGVFPLLDLGFYKSSKILDFKNELKLLGVVTDFDEAAEAFASHFKQQALRSYIRKEHALSLLSCYRKLQTTSHKFPKHLKSCIRNEKWLRTRLGDCKSPGDCILYGPEWESISPIAILPFVDDSENCYGNAIHTYKEELKKLKVVVDLKNGVTFVVKGLYIPHDPCKIAPENVFALLDCIKLLSQNGNSLDTSFKNKLSKKWLKTCVGFKSPDECLLFNSEWASFLKTADGPFIDDEFYGSKIISYRKELNTIGVSADVRKVCSLLATHIYSHSDFSTICRIYNFLRESNWKPECDDVRRIWVPQGCNNGEWVKPEECVIHDKDGLFSLQLKVLEKHYHDRKLLSFFSGEFNVKSYPTVDDYCTLWKVWEKSELEITHAECCAFWSCVGKHWGSHTREKITETVMKLPVESTGDKVMLLDKGNVFIADDLQLKDLFSHHSIFVWYPQPSPPYLPRSKLFEIYQKMGVLKLSESVLKYELSVEENQKLKQVDPSFPLIDKEMVRLILGFFSDPSFEMEPKERHEAVQCLLNLTVLLSSELINVKYSLSGSAGKIADVEASQMIRWEKASSKLFTQKVDYTTHKSRIEYATCFSEAIAKGLLWEKEDRVSELSELIKLGFFVDFNKEAVEFLMKSKNLQVYKGDEDFLSAAFPCR